MNAESAKAERARVVLRWYPKKFIEKEGTRIARLQIKFEFIVETTSVVRHGKDKRGDGQKVKCVGPR